MPTLILAELERDVDGEMLRFIKISSICSSRSILVEVTASCSNGNNAGCLVGAANGSGKADRVLIDEPEPNVDEWLRAGSPLSESLGFMLMLQDLRIRDKVNGLDSMDYRTIAFATMLCNIYYLRIQDNRLYTDTAVTGNWQSKCSVYLNKVVIRCYKR